MSGRTGACVACGLPVARHFTSRNAMVGCSGAAIPDEDLDEGRLFMLKLKHNRAARVGALESIRPLPRGGFQVRIGGRVRGQTIVCSTRKQAETLANVHYNEQMYQFVTRDRTGASR